MHTPYSFPKWLWLLGLLLFSMPLLQAQQQTEPCATDIIHRRNMQNNPEYAANFNRMLDEVHDYLQKQEAAGTLNKTQSTVYTIPVVVHVIHTGEPIGDLYNPTDAAIISMVNGLNDWFRNTGANNSPLGVDIEIEFALAQRDPSCLPTNGIVRVNGSGVPNYDAQGIQAQSATAADEVAVKNLSRWPNTDYYNIWIVKEIDNANGTSGSFIAGYAYFPGAGAAVDGTVMLASQIGPTDTTLPHEIGHALGLFHTFEGSSGAGNCPANATCATQGDRVCDTAPHDADYFQCTSNACSVDLTVLQNIMSYNCADRFTQGQKDRMRAALTTQRASLISSLGATPPPASTPAVACVPTATGTFSGFGVTRVQFNGLDVSSGTSAAEGNYINRTCAQGVTVDAGTSYGVTVQTSVNDHRVRIWIDYNNDGDFNDAGEEVFAGTSTGANPKTVNGSIAIPASGITLNQPLRMRVAADWVGDPTPTPCALSEGQAEDYSIIINGAACAITALSAGTQTACNAGDNTYTQQVTVTFSNAPVAGNLLVNGQSFAIGASPQTVTLTGLVSNGAAVNVTASFSATPTCTFTQNNLFTAPASCAPTTYFSSGANTNWHNAAAWSSVCGGAGGAGIPTALDNVVICAGHTVNHSAAAVCNNLTINATGRLNTRDNYNFTVSGNTIVNGIYRETTQAGGGATKTFTGDVTISNTGEFGSNGVLTNANYVFNGSLINAGTFDNRNNGNTTFGGANESIENNGTMVINQDASGATFFAANYTLLGSAEIRFFAGSTTINNNVVVTNQGNVMFFYGNVLAGNASSHFINAANAIVNFRGSGTIPMNGGLLTTSAAGNTVYYNYGGDSPVRGNQTYHHLVVYIGNKTITGGNIVVNGNLTISNGPVTTLTANNFNIEIKGNWVNNGVFASGTNTVTFSGAAAQTITGATTFHNLTINQTAASTVTPNAAQTVTGQLNLQSGRIVLGANNLTLSNATVANQIAGTFANSWVETNGTGGLIRNGNLAALSDFPVGNNTSVKLISLSAISNTKVRYIAPATPAIPAGLLAAGLNATWRVESSGAASGDVRITNPTGSTTPTSTIRRYNGSQWVELATTYNATPYYQTSGIAIAAAENYAVLAACALTANITAGGATTFCQGADVVLTATPATGVTYQWKNGGTDIGGATNATYTATTSGNYTVLLTDTGDPTCTSLSNAIAVTVNPLPNALTIVANPASVVSGNASAIEVPTSQNGVSYQLQNVTAGNTNVGAPQNGNGGTLTFPTGALTANTDFRVVATNTTTTCSQTLNTVTVTVTGGCTLAPNITAGGATTFCQGGNVVLTATPATGVTYQWRRHNIDIAGATAQTYSADQSGDYTVYVEENGNPSCNAVSNTIAVTVNPLPNDIAIAANPASVPINTGSNIEVANSENGVSYQLQNVTAGNTNVGAPQNGNGGLLTFPTGNLGTSTEFRIIATNTTTTCSRTLTATANISVGDIWNIQQDTYFTTIQAAVNAAIAGQTIKMLSFRNYPENVLVDKSLTFTSDATAYTQVEITGIEMNGVGATLTIEGDMCLTELLNMQNGDVIIDAGANFALRSTAAATAMVINASPTNTVQGNVIAERYMPSVSDLGGYDGVGGYHVLASPFAAAPLSQLGDDMTLILNTAFNTAAEPGLTNPFPTLYVYDENHPRTGIATQYYNGFQMGFFVPTTADFEVGRGYQANISAGGTVDMNGILNNGNLGTLNLTRSSNGLHLLGNPYPSPIVWTQLLANSSGIQNAVYIDIPTSRYGGNYASFVNGVGTNGGTNQIASMQGFWVEATAGGGSITFDNSVRVNSYQNPRFFKTDEKGLKEGLLKLTLKQGENLQDEAAIYFEAGASPQFDGVYDAHKLRLHDGKSPSLYSYFAYPEGQTNAKGETADYFSISGLPSLEGKTIVPLAVDIKTEGEHQISLSEFKYFHDLHVVYLYDSLTQTLHNLRQNADYVFAAKKGIDQNRFVLLFDAPANADFFVDNKLNVYPNPASTAVSFSLKNNHEGAYQIRLLDMVGKEILSSEKNKEGAFLQGTIEIGNLANGVYFLQISSEAGIEQVRFVKE
ncbi:M43 family zinc metalloprotease [Hugenholtzia roseola]|uniref:M43 family zinc metalloprotease n=1 Tax=Hugenholtzia roseola TaxID=1002 RepID=UPI00047E6EB5|nr:M43 family zinc metalloprotease [Hugenholtzia roseola]